MMEYIKKENLAVQSLDAETMEANANLVDELFGSVRKDFRDNEELTEPISSDEGDGFMEAGESEGNETVGSSRSVSYAMPPARSGMLHVSVVMRIDMGLFRTLHGALRVLPGGRLMSLEQGVTIVTTMVPTHGWRHAPVPCGQGVAPSSSGSVPSMVITGATREGGSR